jgi:hypothetical protein
MFSILIVKYSVDYVYHNDNSAGGGVYLSEMDERQYIRLKIGYISGLGGVKHINIFRYHTYSRI